MDFSKRPVILLAVLLVHFFKGDPLKSDLFLVGEKMEASMAAVAATTGWVTREAESAFVELMNVGNQRIESLQGRRRKTHPHFTCPKGQRSLTS